MKSLKSLLLLFALFLVAMPAFAAATIMTPLAAAAVTPHDPSPEDMSVSQKLTYDIAQMDDSQKADALKLIEDGPSDSAKKAKEWVDIGNGIGESLAATATKMGVAVNDFAKTPVGKMAMLLIIWHYMGNEISGILCGLLWFAIFLPMWWNAARKTMGVYNEKGKFIRFDKELFYDKTQYGMIPVCFLVSLVLIVIVGIIFFA